ncbi:hypothetical protein CEXT_400091 [Caerostris extrusa]|uniref:Uncharacterized protein n=1 Tax=Caerostris extrusa TaxID=172846 RepID=A0AAV4QG81_CAEEX|nr:hypothetical protein CEXT_400091 [Caerostris extrusa]
MFASWNHLYDEDTRAEREKSFGKLPFPQKKTSASEVKDLNLTTVVSRTFTYGESGSAFAAVKTYLCSLFGISLGFRRVIWFQIFVLTTVCDTTIFHTNVDEQDKNVVKKQIEELSDINPHIKSVTLECAVKDKCGDPTAKRKQSGCIQSAVWYVATRSEYRRWETAKLSPNGWKMAVEL